MACIALPAVAIPTLPAPLTLTAPVPSLTIPDVSLCCKLPPLPISIPPIPIPSAILNPAVIAALNAFVKQMTSYINALPLSCPLE